MRQLWLIGLPLLTAACGGGDFSASNENGGNGTGAAGSSGSGGTATGGTAGTGGSSTGGSSTGGSQGGSGGTVTTGGTAGTGGAVSSGGVVATGGGMSTGGVVGSGGSTGTGGISSGGTVGTGGGMSTGGSPPIVDCELGTFLTLFDRTCMSDQDCALVWHNIDGCNQIVMAINHNAQNTFSDAEANCSSQLDTCSYDPLFFQTEDGTQVPYSAESSAAAACLDSRCQSVYSGQRYACGTMTCADINFCGAQVSSSGMNATTYGCGPLPAGCNDCTCTDAATMAGCQCSTDSGHVFVTCTVN
jgi:hypothetical protein